MSNATESRPPYPAIDVAQSRSGRAFRLAPDRRPPLLEVPRLRLSLRRPLRLYAPVRIARTTLAYELR